MPSEDEWIVYGAGLLVAAAFIPWVLALTGVGMIGYGLVSGHKLDKFLGDWKKRD